MGVDLRLHENMDGGDTVLKGNELQMIFGFQNAPYIGMFGGNVEQSTTGPKNINEQSFDFWGNYLISPSEPKFWFNSETEKLLTNIELSAISRIEIEETVKSDLSFMNDFAEISVSVALISVDKLRISITILEPGNLQSNEFTYIWDATEQELSQGEIEYPAHGPGIALDNLLDFGL